jgi:hypothetical protein
MKEAETEKTTDGTTEYILSKPHQEAYNHIRAVLKRPLFIQRWKYFNNKIPLSYNAVVVVNKEEKLSVIDKSFRVAIGNNGLYITQQANKAIGVTYLKKGRTNARLNFWGLNHPFERNELLFIIAEKINPNCKSLLEDETIKSIATKGLYAAIIGGKITNITEAMTYYIRYSLRGLNIELDQALSLYEFFKEVQSSYIAKSVLRTAKYPNKLLKEFSPSFITSIDDKSKRAFKTKLARKGTSLIDLSHSTGEKIDWLNQNIDLDDELEVLRKKSKWIEDVSELWEGGPILSSSSQSASKTGTITPWI